MPSDQYYGDQIRAALRAQLQRNIAAACIFVQGKARANVRAGGPSGLHRITGQLINSIAYDVGEGLGRVGTNLVYARIHELGGVITPKSAGALAVPVHPDARRASGPRQFSDLRLVRRSGRPALLVRDTAAGKGRHERAVTNVMYVLLKSVTIPARPYLRPALNNNMDRVRELLARGIGK